MAILPRLEFPGTAQLNRAAATIALPGFLDNQIESTAWLAPHG